MKWGRPYKQADRHTDEYKKECPPTPHSTKKGGSNKYGGWTQEGRIAFAKYRKLIQQGRNKVTTKEAEDDMRLILKKKHESKPKKKVEEQAAIDLSQAGIGFEDDMEEVLEEEGYDSEEEANAMRQVKENMNAKKRPSEEGATSGSSSKKTKKSRKASADESGADDDGEEDA